MRKTQTEYKKKYFEKFKRPTITIPAEHYEDYKDYITGKGYNSFNDYVNAVIQLDYKNNIIPSKNDIAADD